MLSLIYKKFEVKVLSFSEQPPCKLDVTGDIRNTDIGFRKSTPSDPV